MIYSLNIKEDIKKHLLKLKKKNLNQFLIIRKKIAEIIENPHHYKNLKAPLNHLKRVHIDKHFVLIFSVDEEAKTVMIEDYDHHDRVYR